MNFAAIITTGVFRFSNFGKLASYCEYPIKFDENVINPDLYLNEKRTYADDAKVIFIIWILQMLSIASSCFISVFISKPPSDEQIVAKINIEARLSPLI